jgi:hypothetical protein
MEKLALLLCRRSAYSAMSVHCTVLEILAIRRSNMAMAMKFVQDLESVCKGLHLLHQVGWLHVAQICS